MKIKSPIQKLFIHTHKNINKRTASAPSIEDSVKNLLKQFYSLWYTSVKAISNYVWN